MKKNKLIPSVLIFLLTMSIATGCGSNPSDNESAAAPKEAKGTNYADGTYEGSSDAGIAPGLKVSVDVKDGKITTVNVIEHHETEGIGTLAIEELPALIIEAQSTDVDSVSGATTSSTAIKEAVDKALAQAK